MSALKIELIVWHHKRRTRRQPYSAAAYLLDPSKPQHHQVIEAVAAAYGWSWPMGDDEILEKLLELNGERTERFPARKD